MPSKKLLLLLPALLALCCSTTRQLKPLGPGNQAVDLSLGGPLFKLGGNYIPMPLSSVGYTRGVTDRVNVFGVLHPTGLAFGMIDLESGILWRPWEKKGRPAYFPGTAAIFHLHLMTDGHEWPVKAYPQIDLVFDWDYGRQSYFYAGLTNWFELSATRTLGGVQHYQWIPAPLLGTCVGFNRLGLTAELKWDAAFFEQGYIVVDYLGIKDRGALAPFLGISWKWGKAE